MWHNYIHIITIEKKGEYRVQTNKGKNIKWKKCFLSAPFGNIIQNQINIPQLITTLFVYIGIHTMPKAPSPNFSKSLNWCLGNSGTFGKLVHNSSNCELTGMCNVVNSSPPLLLDALWKCCCWCCQGCCCWCCKGQLISESLFDGLNFPKNQRKNLMYFCHRI